MLKLPAITTTVLWPFVRDYPGKPVPEETFTHSPILIIIQPLSASSIYYNPQHVQFTCLTIFLHNLCPCPLWSTSSPWSPPPHTPYIALPNQCLLFTAYAHTIAACFAVVPRLYHLFLICTGYKWMTSSLCTCYSLYQYISCVQEMKTQLNSSDNSTTLCSEKSIPLCFLL